MFKKIFAIVFISYFFSISAYNQADLDLVLNPKCRAVCGLDLSGANLSGQNLSHKNFLSVDFSGAMLEGVNFTGCYFTDCFFVDAHFGPHVMIEAATFLKCNLYKILYAGPDFFSSCHCVDQLTQDTFRGVLVEAKFYSEIAPYLPGSGLCRSKQIATEQQFIAAPSAEQEDMSDDSGVEFYDAPETGDDILGQDGSK